MWGHKHNVVAAVRFWSEPLLNGILSPSFLDDEEVFLAFLPLCCSDPKAQLLFRFSDRIRSNVTLMLQLVQQSGLCLRFVSHSLKRNRDIALAACCQHYKALEYLDPMLLRDKEFIMRVLSGTRRCLIPALRNILPKVLQDDHEIVDYVDRIMDVGRQPMDVGRQPIPEVVLSEDFWLSSDSPAEFDADDVREALTNFPDFSGNRIFWKKVVQSEQIYGNGLLHTLIANHAAPEIRLDKRFMQLACSLEPEVYGVLPASLQEDREVLEATIDAEYYCLEEFRIPFRAQNMHPDLALRAMQKSSDDFYIHPQQISPTLWFYPGVAEVFLDDQNGEWRNVPPLPPGVPAELRDHEAFGLVATKHTCTISDFEAFTSAHLRSSKAFIMKAVARNPICLGAAVGSLSRDFDVAAVAFSHQIYSWSSLFGHDDDGANYDLASKRSFLYSIAAKARERVLNFRGFTEGFLSGFTDNPGPDCVLPLLVQDKETSVCFKRLVRDFVDVPKREEVDRLHAVSLNLLFLCLPDPNHLSMYCMSVPGSFYCFPKSVSLE